MAIYTTKYLELYVRENEKNDDAFLFYDNRKRQVARLGRYRRRD